jgi:protein PhnA
MTSEEELQARSGSKCELCAATTELSSFELPPDSRASVLLCGTCKDQVEGSENLDAHHWRCLNESMWSEVPAVQVLAWRILSGLDDEGWARDLLETLYLDEETLAWAESGAPSSAAEVKHVDSNGVLLATGDTVTLIKDLVVKGAGFTAKRGTAVRGISVVPENSEHLEGRVNGQRIVILTKFVKKS